MKKLKQSRFSLISIPTLVGALFALTFFIGIGVTAHVYAASSDQVADGQKLVTIHDGSETRGIVTKDATLRDVFRDAGIPITDQDLVEPSLDTQLTVNNYEVNVYRARPITIVDGQVKKRVMSPYRTARQVVEHAGMMLHDEDRTTLTANQHIIADGPGLVLTIDRATPFTLVLYGKKVHAYTQANTVGAMLKEKDITLGPKDDASKPLDTAITAGMTIKIWRNGVQTVTKTETIKFHVKQIRDADQPVGYKKITTPGVNGKKEVTYQLTMKNGKIIKKKKIQSVTTKKPVGQIEIIGTKMKNSFNGSFSEALAKLRSCEGSYTSNTGNGYYGAYQFDIGTWGGYKGYPNAAAAPPKVQDEKAWETYKRRGWSPWPSCSVSQGLKDIYR